jgi:hypothetical protein
MAKVKGNYYVNLFLDDIEASSLSGNDTDDVFLYTSVTHSPPGLPDVPEIRYPSQTQYWKISGGPNRIPPDVAQQQGSQIAAFLQGSYNNQSTAVNLRLTRMRHFPHTDDILGTAQMTFSTAYFCYHSMLMIGWEFYSHDAELIPSPWGGPYTVLCHGNGCLYKMILRIESELTLHPPPGCREFQDHIEKRKIRVGWKWPLKKKNSRSTKRT